MNLGVRLTMIRLDPRILLCWLAVSCLGIVGCRPSARCGYPGACGCDPCPPVGPTPEDRERALRFWTQEYQRASAGGLSSSECDRLADDARRLEVAEADLYAGIVRHECGQLEQAQEHYEEAIQRRVTASRAALNLGVLVWEQGDKERAAAFFERAFQLEPQSIPANNDYAVALYEAYVRDPTDERFEAARRRMAAALAYDSDNRTAYENLARLYYDRGRLQDRAALRLSELVISQGLRVLERTGETSADLHNTRGLILVQRGEPSRASRAFEAALKIEPNHPEANLNAAHVALRFRDFDRARGALARVADHPRYRGEAATYLALGTAHRGMRQFDAAREAFERATELPGGEDGWYDLGILFQEHVAPGTDSEEPWKQARESFERYAERGRDEAAIAEAKRRVGVIDETLRIREELEALERQWQETQAREERERQRERERLLELERRAREAASSVD